MDKTICPRDERFYRVLTYYLEQADLGCEPHLTELIARHPEFAYEVIDFLDDFAWLSALTAPLGRHLRQTSTRPAPVG